MEPRPAIETSSSSTAKHILSIVKSDYERSLRGPKCESGHHGDMPRHGGDALVELQSGDDPSLPEALFLRELGVRSPGMCECGVSDIFSLYYFYLCPRLSLSVSLLPTILALRLSLICQITLRNKAVIPRPRKSQRGNIKR